MMELWSVNREFQLRSLAVQFPEAPLQHGRLLTITGITIKTSFSLAIAAENTKAVVQSLFKGASSLMKAIAPPTKKLDPLDLMIESESGAAEAEREAADTEAAAAQRPRTYWLCGVRYNGMEQCLRAVEQPEAEASTTAGSLQRYFAVQQTQVVITSDRNIIVTMYEVDDNLQVLSESVGKVSFNTFQEPSLKTTLAPLQSSQTDSGGSYDAEVIVTAVLLLCYWSATGMLLLPRCYCRSRCCCCCHGIDEHSHH